MRLAAILAALGLFGSVQAWAARSASVVGNASGQAALLSAPKPSAQSLAVLHGGDPITVSNYPTNGYYKARTASGQVGWIATSSVGNAPAAQQALPPPPAPEQPSISTAPPPPQYESIPYQDVQSGESRAYEEHPAPSKGPRLPFEIKAFGGIQQLQSPLSLSQAGVTLGSSMPYYGAQVGVPLNSRIFLLLRLEHLSSSSSQAGYDFSLSATPLTTGISYLFSPPSSKVRLRGSALLGVAFSTTLDATATGQPAPNESVLSTQAFTEMLKLDCEAPVASRFAFYAEAGYRFLGSSSVGPSTIVNGSSIFQQGGNTVPISLSFSGVFAGGGLAFYL